MFGGKLSHCGCSVAAPAASNGMPLRAVALAFSAALSSSWHGADGAESCCTLTWTQ
jgi:hypothetical protein